MSVMICKDETFERTVKVLHSYCVHRFGEVYQLPVIQAWYKNIATLNCESYAECYNEDVELEFDEMSYIPELELTAQDIMSARCWHYQIEGSCTMEHIYEMVDRAIDWAKEKYQYTQDMYDACQWG